MLVLELVVAAMIGAVFGFFICAILCVGNKDNKKENKDTKSKWIIDINALSQFNYDIIISI